MDRENIMPKKIEFESCDHLPERGFAHRIGWPGARVRSPTSTFPNVRKKNKNPNNEKPLPGIVTVNSKKRVCPVFLEYYLKKKKKKKRYWKIPIIFYELHLDGSNSRKKIQP